MPQISHASEEFMLLASMFQRSTCLHPVSVLIVEYPQPSVKWQLSPFVMSGVCLRSCRFRIIRGMPTLRELRERAVLSQADLEALSGVARTTISELERGTRKKPFPRTIRKLAKALGCKPNEIEITFQKGRA